MESISTPYQNVAESFADYGRQLLRRALETVGLPASPDVGRLSIAINHLRRAVETQLGQKISSVTITVPSIVALYEEDLRDALAYSNLQYVEIFPYDNHRRIHDTGALYAGLGLDIHSPNEREFYIVVQYSRNCLITSLAEVTTQFDADEYPHYENFTLGLDASHTEDKYWDKVAIAIQRPLKDSYVPRRISKVLVHGESSRDLVFREVLERAIDGIQDEELVPDYADDPVFVAAKGAAELGRRALAGREQEKGVDEL